MTTTREHTLDGASDVVIANHLTARDITLSS
jgi:hypothetical protein